jgi:hypothetical protein
MLLELEISEVEALERAFYRESDRIEDNFGGDSERHYRVGVRSNKFWKVPRHCPLVLLIEYDLR